MLEQRVLFLEDTLREVRPDILGESSSPSGSQRTMSNHYPTPLSTDTEYRELSDLSSMIGTLSLNAAGAEPPYLGSSSAFAFARFVEPSLRQVVSPMPPKVLDNGGHNLSTPEPCALPDYHTAVRLSNAYFQNIHPQYPFLHEPTFRTWESALEDPFTTMETLDYKSVPLYFLNMV